MHITDQLGGAVLELALCLRQINVFALVLDRKFGAGNELTTRLLETHALGTEGFNNLCLGLVEAGLLDSGDTLPGDPPEMPSGSTLQ